MVSKSADLHLTYDVGHSSIGWAVLRQGCSQPLAPEILGTGVVTFGSDDCLAVKRRQYRQARRHVRSTRQRIANMERLLVHLGVLSEGQVAAAHQQGRGDSFAWNLAAEILVASRIGSPLPNIGWVEAWNMLRWYAHNRGYYAPPWAARADDFPENDDDVPDTEKVRIAQANMQELGTCTMAETIAAYTRWYELEVSRWQKKDRPDKPTHFKGLKAAFPRDSVVWPEVHSLLTALKGRLPKLDDDLIRTLLGDTVDPMKDCQAWKTVDCPGLVLPKRYHGGLLFGQMIPRFENRIIGVCPIHYARRQAELLAAGLSDEAAKHEAEKQAKLPSKSTPEFLRYRWATQLANVFGAKQGDPETRALSQEERLQLTQQGEKQGAFGKVAFKKLIRKVTGWTRDNLDNMLMHPDADDALVLDPAQYEISKSRLAGALEQLSEQFHKRLHGKLTHGKTVTLAEVRGWLNDADAAIFDEHLQSALVVLAKRKGKKPATTTRESLLAEQLRATFPTGRAPYARPILRQAYEEVMKGWDPRAEKNSKQPRGCLCQTQELREAQLQRRLEEQTNNHLIRHRILILERLQRDLIAAPEFADGKPERIGSLTIEVNRDIRDLSGKTRKEQEQDLGLKMGDFKRVSAKVEEACARRNIPVTAGLIRKARVAEDLGWECPYTGKGYSMDTLLDGVMDKDHIIPHADRESDSLDSLVITWKEINLWKGKRTAMEFIRDEGGKPVPGRQELTLFSPAEFKKFVEGLDVRKGHNDDRNRKKRRVSRLQTETYEEKEFTPRDLTVTSHLVRLGAQRLQRAFPAQQRPPVISLPGSVTGEVRKAWRLMGCLSLANPHILDSDGKTPLRKQEIRNITHLHHALDACVLGLSALYFPRNGTFWSSMVKAGADREADADRRLWLAMTRRRPSAAEAALLKSTGLYQRDSESRLHLTDLPTALKEQLRQRLAEKRVVQHIPADMSGIKVEENTRGVIGEKDGRILLRQYSARDPKTGLRSRKPTEESPGKLLGLVPAGEAAKLQSQKGVRIITDNFGVALLDHARDEKNRFVVIPWHRVWHRLEELKARNEGVRPRVLRIGCTIRIKNKTGRSDSDYRGTWLVRGVQNDLKKGVLVDICSPDVVNYRIPGRKDCKRDVRLQTLVKGGLEILAPSYAGTPTLEPHY